MTGAARLTYTLIPAPNRWRLIRSSSATRRGGSRSSAWRVASRPPQGGPVLRCSGARKRAHHPGRVQHGPRPARGQGASGAPARRMRRARTELHIEVVHRGHLRWKQGSGQVLHGAAEKRTQSKKPGAEGRRRRRRQRRYARAESRNYEPGMNREYRQLRIGDNVGTGTCNFRKFW